MFDCAMCQFVKYILLLFFTVVLIAYLYMKWAFGYWKRKGVEVAIEPSFPFGNIGAFFDGKSYFTKTFEELYDKTKGPFTGFYKFGSPALLIKVS